MAKRKPTSKSAAKKKAVESFKHDDASRRNIPTAELESVVEKDVQKPIPVTYDRPGSDTASVLTTDTQQRNPDKDPQLVWRGKADKPLSVQSPALYIQEKVHPKVLVDDLRRQSEAADIARKLKDSKHAVEPDDLSASGGQLDLFADFNGIPDHAQAKTEFYQHDQHWSNRMILGDSLQVMASLAEREGLRGKVQCIYLDPPYGIKFNSNFQWSTTSRDVKDGNKAHITREPEMVKAFRDTWRDGIHSYLTYLRDRLTAAKDLLTDSGSIFVQIGDENVHRVRAVMDEVFGDENYISTINFATTGGLPSAHLSRIGDFILMYAKDKSRVKWRKMKESKKGFGEEGSGYNRVELEPFSRRSASTEEKNNPENLNTSWRIYSSDNLNGQGPPPAPTPFHYGGEQFHPSPNSHWKPNYPNGLQRLARANRIEIIGKNLRYVRFFEDNPSSPIKNIWLDTSKAGFASVKAYVVETNASVVERCLLMATDPGDLVLDPTCGSGTTAYVAEQWGRRWITIDTSRVALALARARIMGARYPYYLLADSEEGRQKEAQLTHKDASSQPSFGNIRHGFVYERVPHVTLKSIANNTEIDVIWDKAEARLLPVREALTKLLPDKWLATYRKGQKYAVDVPQVIQEWEVPRECPADWSDKARALHERFWHLRIERQKEIDASIAAKADFEYLYDRPYEDKKKVRVAGPFTVESISPHRVISVGADDELIDPLNALEAAGEDTGGVFVKMVMENLKTAGVQQAHKEDKITFMSITPWPGHYIGAEGRYVEGESDEDSKANKGEKRAAIFIGPEFGTVRRSDLATAAREAGEAGFDVLIACAFNYEGHASEFDKLGRIPILKARMNADLHMAGDLKNTGKGNLFVIFGEPDIDLLPPVDAPQDAGLEGYATLRVRINGVDVFDPATGDVRSDDADGIACWFIDTDYNEESFFVRQAYFLGANDPYKSLKTTLKAEINREAWESLHSDTSREFPKPQGGKIAVKVINHLGDEVMKVFRVE